MPGTLIALLLAALPLQVLPLQKGTVMSVENGQVVVVRLGRGDRRVRLACVDAPEQSQQPWAQQSKAALASELPVGTAVTVELRARDVYDRIVGVVRRGGFDVAPEMLKNGMLFVHDGYLGRCDDLPYGAAETTARELGVGVWNRPGGIQRPWNLRLELNDANQEP